MRSGRDNGVLQTESGSVIGINLGADYCSEHEWGIKGIRAAFGIPDKGYGLTKRTISKMPKAILFDDSKEDTLLICFKYSDQKLPASQKEREEFLSRYYLGRGYSDKDAIRTAWDEGSFGIRAFKPLDREALRALYQAMQTNDLSIWLGGGGVFQNAGLVLALKSRIPFEKAQQLHDADVDYENLQKAAEKTGIAAKLEKAGKRYFALSPRWNKTDGKQDRTKTNHPVIFWLNPMEQQIHNFGWFTVEELELWAQGRGPCMMSDAEKAKRAR